MFKLTYDVYYMTRMLKDKVLSSIYDYYYDEYHTVKRMEPHQGGIITNLYNLTYEPTQILDRIYLGNAYNASNFIDLKMRNIGLIVNITCEIPNYYTEDFKYHTVNTIKDNNENHIESHIDSLIEVINNYLETNDDNILVHCFMGSSRSASVLVAYNTFKNDVSIDESIKFVKDKRDVVNINTTFIQDLKNWNNKRNTINTINTKTSN